MTAIGEFRMETRAWLAEHCPAGARDPGPDLTGATKLHQDDPDIGPWLERIIEKGWVAATWPAEYGGGGLSNEEHMVLVQEMRRIDARVFIVDLASAFIGATLLEYGTDDQKRRHIPPIARGELLWCQGYSEPGSGSDLASLRTEAQDRGDHFVINGQKIWTSGAQFADWMYALVRTDPDAPKHQGISFVLLDMAQPGVTVRPIPLINGDSPFCETFFEDAIARKDDLVGELNRGWTVGKRLLQHERGSMTSLAGGGAARGAGTTLEDTAKRYAGEDGGRIAAADLRHEIVTHNMNDWAYRLTQRRAVEEARGGGTPGPATSIFKVCEAELRKRRSSLFVSMRGTGGLGWSGDAFDPWALEDTRTWLYDRSASIAGGSNEIQRNIIAKRVLGLPD